MFNNKFEIKGDRRTGRSTLALEWLRTQSALNKYGEYAYVSANTYNARQMELTLKGGPLNIRAYGQYDFAKYIRNNHFDAIVLDDFEYYDTNIKSLIINAANMHNIKVLVVSSNPLPKREVAING